MSQLLTSFQARAALGPIPIEELLGAQEMARASEDKAAEKAIAAMIRDAWGTPRDLFAELHQKHKFTIDTCAEAWNAKLTRFWGPGGEAANALAQSLVGETWFCNPPFSEIEQWLKWIWSFYDPTRPRAGTGVLLIPATRTEQAWWSDPQFGLIEPYRDNPAKWEEIRCEVRLKLLCGRTHYDPPPGVKDSSPRFGSCTITWTPI